MMLSVCMITYNHESFIAKAIEGILMQKTDFDIELIIGEDYSSDKTSEICKEYKNKFPNKIRLLLNERNIGVMPNFIQTLNSCSGNYIALCEGDDYWTDPYKLQKQVDFLEANEDFVICHHNMQIDYENDASEQHLSNSPEQKEVYTIEDLALRYSIFTSSSIFRNGLIKKLPDWFYKYSLGDYMLYMIIAQYGKIRYLPDVMGVYRVHEKGVWSMLSENSRFEKQLDTLKEFMTHFKTNDSVCNCLKIRYIEICLHLINTKDENYKNAILKLLNEVEPGYFYEKYIDSDDRFNKLYGSRKNLIKALIEKQIYHSKKFFSLNK